MLNSKRILSLILSVVLILSCFPNVPIMASAATASGTCGDNLTWVLADDGTLTISGTGEMDISLNDNWNANMSAVKAVVIENGVTTISEHAFSFCDSLTQVEISDSVTDIGDDAFYACDNLTGIWVGEGNAVYASDGKGVLFNKDKTRLIQAPGGISGEYVIPDGTTNVGHNAFRGCAYLTSVSIPSSCTSLGNYTFQDCTSLTGIWVDEENAVFSSDSNGVLFNKDKTNLIQSPGGIIGEYAIPSGVKTISYCAFKNCANLTHIIIPDSVIEVEYSVFYGCTNLIYVRISDSVTYLANETFGYCENLTSVEIPDSVTSIGAYAFYNCSNLTNINIPVGVTEIAYYTFAGCAKLSDVYYDGKQEQWDSIEIDNSNEFFLNATIHIMEAVSVAQLITGDGTAGEIYSSVEAAMEAYTDGYIQLLSNVTETVQITKNVFINLNGFNMTAQVSEGANLYAMDRQTDDYLVGEDTLGVLTIVGDYIPGQTQFTESGEIYRYLALPSEDGTYTFHRFCLNTRKGLRTYSAAGRTGIYFQPEFRSDEVVIAAIDNGDNDTWNIGVKVQMLDGSDNKIEFAPINGTDSAGAAALANGAIYRVAIYDLMPTNAEITGRVSKNTTKYLDCSAWTEAAYLETFDLSAYEVEGTAYIMINGTVILDESGADCISLQNAIKQVDQMYDTLSDTQKQAVSNMWAIYSRAISSWFAPVDGGLDDFLINIGNIKIDISDWFD